MNDASRIRGMSAAAEQKPFLDAGLTICTKAPKAVDGKGMRKASLEHVKDAIDALLEDASKIVNTTKLTVEGRWVYGYEMSGGDNKLAVKNDQDTAHERIAQEESEWMQAIQPFKNLIAVTRKLTTFT